MSSLLWGKWSRIQVFLLAPMTVKLEKGPRLQGRVEGLLPTGWVSSATRMGLIRGLCYGSCLPSANNSTSTTNIKTASTMWTPYHPVRSKPQVPPQLSDVTLGDRWALPHGLAGVDSWASHLAFMGVNEGGVIPFLCMTG